MSKPSNFPAIDLKNFEPGTRTDFHLPLFDDALGGAVSVPFIVMRGAHDGPTIGVCAAVHGDELNGIRIIHKLLEETDPTTLRGSIICCPIVNVPAYEAGTRVFPDGSDLNHAFPGKWRGRTSEQYAKRFASVFLPNLDILIDIHTASGGRINSFYVRADMLNPKVAKLATLVNPDIILHVKGGDATLRHAAQSRGIDAITVEAGNPRVFQRGVVESAIDGVQNILRSLDAIDGTINSDDPAIICARSQWLFTQTGGLLETRFTLLEQVKKGQVLAVTRTPFGNITATYTAPNDGIIIGMARNPVSVPGTRFVHLGTVGTPVAKKAEKA